MSPNCFGEQSCTMREFDRKPRIRSEAASMVAGVPDVDVRSVAATTRDASSPLIWKTRRWTAQSVPDTNRADERGASDGRASW